MLRPYVFIQLWQANVDFHISKMCLRVYYSIIKGKDDAFQTVLVRLL